MEKFKVGDKVVPHKKSVGRPLEQCDYWNSAREEGQPYLYVLEYGSIGISEYVYTLHSDQFGFGGNFYKEEDLTLYVEEADKKPKQESVKTMENKTHKYEVGQKVRIRRDLNVEKSYGMHHNRLETLNTVNATMVKMAGKIVEIVGINKRSYDVEGSPYNWTDEMLEPVVVEKPETVKIEDVFGITIKVEKVIYANPATIIFYKTTDDPKEVVKRSVAKCNPKDEYNRENGYKVAVLKATRKIIDRKLRAF